MRDPDESRAALARALPGQGAEDASPLDIAATAEVLDADPRLMDHHGGPITPNVATMRAALMRWALRRQQVARKAAAADEAAAVDGAATDSDLFRVDDQGMVWFGEQGPGSAAVIRWREADFDGAWCGPLVTLRVVDVAAVVDRHDPNMAWLLQRPLLWRPSFDQPVELFDGTAVVAGEFPAVAGGPRRPRLFPGTPRGASRGVMLEVPGVGPFLAEAALAKHPGAVEIVDSAPLAAAE